MPRAMARTASVNSSREPSRATWWSSHGTTRAPATIIRAAKMAALPRAMTSSPIGPKELAAWSSTVPPSIGAIVGRSTSTTTVNRSSTMSQPTAMRPCAVSRSPRSISARSRTTVLATDTARPSTSPPPRPQPSASPSATPRSVATRIWPIAPGMAIDFTANRSRIEKWMPTPNIRRITPSSASSVAMSWSATKPGVNGPIATPAAM